MESRPVAAGVAEGAGDGVEGPVGDAGGGGHQHLGMAQALDLVRLGALLGDVAQGGDQPAAGRRLRAAREPTPLAVQGERAKGVFRRALGESLQARDLEVFEVVGMHELEEVLAQQVCGGPAHGLGPRGIDLGDPQRVVGDHEQVKTLREEPGGRFDIEGRRRCRA